MPRRLSNCSRANWSWLSWVPPKPAPAPPGSKGQGPRRPGECPGVHPQTKDAVKIQPPGSRASPGPGCRPPDPGAQDIVLMPWCSQARAPPAGKTSSPRAEGEIPQESGEALELPPFQFTGEPQVLPGLPPAMRPRFGRWPGRQRGPRGGPASRIRVLFLHCLGLPRPPGPPLFSGAPSPGALLPETPVP